MDMEKLRRMEADDVLRNPPSRPLTPWEASEALKPRKWEPPSVMPYAKLGVDEKSKKPYVILGIQGTF